MKKTILILIAVLLTCVAAVSALGYVTTSTVLDVGHGQTPTSMVAYKDGVAIPNQKVTFAKVTSATGAHGLYTLSNYTADTHDYHVTARRSDGTKFYAVASRMTDYGPRFTNNSTAANRKYALTNVSTITDSVWNEVAASHITAGTTGKKLTDAASAGDPWGTAIPGAYAAGTAGYIVGHVLVATGGNVPVDSEYGGACALCVRNAYGAPVQGASVIAIKKTDYTAGNRAEGYQVGPVYTDSSGKWGQNRPLMLAPSTIYILVISKPGSITPKNVQITIP